MCRAIGRGGAEALEVLVPDCLAEGAARALLGELPALRFHRIAYGDIWLRDTAPVFNGGRSAVCFRFDGWGGKYRLPGDEAVAARVAGAAGRVCRRVDLVCEGGAVDGDGEGTLLASRSCLLSRARNEGLGEAEVTRRLLEAYRAERVLWLDGMLQNDHTDGHVDTLARFVAPGRVAVMVPGEAADPNAAVLRGIGARLRRARDAAGRRLEVVELPSPGRVDGPEGAPLPASYLNFYVANEVVVAPVYGVRSDAQAVDALAACFPEREVVGIDARALLCGGGAFHCITQQEPA